MKEFYAELRRKNETTLATLRRELGGVRTGRASISLLDGITVEYYGTPTPLNQVATLLVPEPRLIVIQPWDASLLKEIEKAIMRSDLGLTPVNDGRIIRVPIPPLTEERRKQLVKLVKKMAEDSKVAIRNVRREAIEQIRRREKEGELTEDELRKAQEEIQKITDEYISKVDELLAVKEREILEV